MEFTGEGIILLRHNFREADRMVSVYTKDHGRLNLRFSGVNKAGGKMKALSEPFVHAALRVYVRRGATIGCVTGGKVESVFPGIRQNLNRTKIALHFCDLMFRLTPENQPNEYKFNLLLESLKQVESAPLNPAYSAAFILRLMTHAGFGMDRPALGITQKFWDMMHEAPLSALNFEKAEELVFLNKTNYICRRFLNRYLNYPLNTLKEEFVSVPLYEDVRTPEKPALQTI